MSSKSKKPGASPRAWGLRENVVLRKLQGRKVKLSLADRTRLCGDLVGYSPYWLTIMIGDQLLLVAKAQVVTLGLGEGGWASIAKDAPGGLRS